MGTAMYSRNVGPEPPAPRRPRHLLGRIVDSIWRWQGRKIAYRQDDVHHEMSLAMHQDYTKLALREAVDEPGQEPGRTLPDAELTEEQRRQAIEDSKRRPRFG